MLHIKIIILMSIFQIPAWAAPIKLLAKQKIEDIRFLSSDNKITYYQSENGVLYVSANYSTTKLLSLNKETKFLVSQSDLGKIYIQAIVNDLENFEFKKNYQLYQSSPGSEKIEKIDDGRNPDDHKHDWFSYFDYDKSILIFKRKGSTKPIKVNLMAKANPFFIPQKNALGPDTLVYTDINSNGEMALLELNAFDQSFRPIYKAPAGYKIEFCIAGDNIILGQFPLSLSEDKSSIWTIPIFNNPQYQNKQILYQSLTPDRGQMICDNKNIYFIKTAGFDNKTKIKTTVPAQINIQSRKLAIMKDLKGISSIFKMDNKILAIKQGVYYLIKGRNENLQDALGSDVSRNLSE